MMLAYIAEQYRLLCFDISILFKILLYYLAAQKNRSRSVVLSKHAINKEE